MGVEPLKPSDPLEVVRRFIIDSTDRRDDLDGRKWADLRRIRAGEMIGPGDQPYNLLQSEQGGPITLVEPAKNTSDGYEIQSDTKTGLACFLTHCFLPIRWEGENGFLQHRGVASAGGLYPIELRLCGNLGSGPALYSLDPRQHFLAELETRPDLQDDRKVRLLLSGRIDWCLDPYGDLSGSLIALEAGMLAAQLTLFAGSVGWDVDCEAVQDPTSVRKEFALYRKCDVPLVIMTLTAESVSGLLNGLAPARRKVFSPPDLADGLRRFPRLAGYLEACEAASPDISASALAAPSSPAILTGFSLQDLKQLCRSRSAGAKDGVGRPIETWRDAELDAFARAFGQSAMAGPSDELLPLCAISLTLRHSSQGYAAFEFDCSTGQLTPIEAADPAQIGQALEVGGGAMEIAIGIDDVAALNRSGPRGYLLSNILAGVLAQRLTLAATSCGRDARPLRSYDDGETNRLLPYSHRTALQIRVARSIRPNPALAIA